VPIKQLVVPLAVNGKVYTAMQDVESDALLSSAQAVKLDGFAGHNVLCGPGGPGGPGMPYALWVGTAGAADLIDGYGDVMANFPLLAGYNPIVVSELTSLGTAANIWGLY